MLGKKVKSEKEFDNLTYSVKLGYVRAMQRIGTRESKFPNYCMAHFFYEK